MYKIALLRNESNSDFLKWDKVLSAHEDVEHTVIDLTKSDWFERCTENRCDIFIAKPPGMTSIFKELFDERMMILSKIKDFTIYPSINEILIYENKRYLSYYLKANKIPCPNTFVFYHKEEAISFVKNSAMPIVAKVNIGASGNGVNIFKVKKDAVRYIKTAFSRGVGNRVGPKINKGSLLEKIHKVVTNKGFISRRLNEYKSVYMDKQKDFVIFQEYIKHDFEWRCVRIGDSFFAHKKMIKDNKASGSLEKGYENPPIDLMNFIKEISDEHGLTSVAIDVFENPSGRGYLVNEIQTIFGQSDSFQMKVDGEIGRYIYKNGWVFQKGDFNTNQSFDLRLNHVIELMKKNNLM